MLADIVGWLSAVILALTISRQVYTQWRSRSIGGVSKWLFVGQLAASLGFTVYSYLLDNIVFVCTNFFMFLTAVAGEFIYMRNRRLAQHGAQPEGEPESEQGSEPGSEPAPRVGRR